MPIYTYECQQCSERVQMIQKLSDGAPEECPSCGASQSMRKVITPISSRRIDKSTVSTFEDDLPASAHKPLSKPRDPNKVRDDHGHWVDKDPDADRIAADRKKQKKKAE